MDRASEDGGINAPLIADRSPDAEDGSRAGSPDATRQVTTLRNAGHAVWLLTFAAGLSGLLFGYDTGVVSSTLVSIGTDLDGRPLTTGDKSLITAVTSLLALISSPLTGYLADRYGRRSVILVANVLFILGAAGQAAAEHVASMVVGRAVVGAAIGLASCATPLYITELAPAEIRGRLVTIQSLFITGGQVVAYLIGWLLAGTPAGWRWMVGLGAAPAIVQFCLLALMFETPRWLVKVGRTDSARTILFKVYGGLDEDERHRTVESVLNDIRTELSQESKLHDDDEPLDEPSSTNQIEIIETARQLFFLAGNRRALTIACMLHAFQQLCGFNSLMYYSATIFALVGLSSPIAASLCVALTNFIFTIAAFNYIDTVGRRRILLRSVPVMVLGLLASSAAFHFIPLGRSQPPTPDPEDPSVPSSSSSSSRAAPIALLASMTLYVAAYAIGLGCVPWQQSELFPLRVRSLGSGLATAANWSSNLVIGASFLPLLDALGASPTFALYAGVCALGWLAVWRVYPETAGLQLEGIGEVLREGWGVKESVERFRARKGA